MNKVTWFGKEITGNVRSAAMQGVMDAAEAILDRSNSKAPIDEGTLINSGQVTPDEQSLSATISYDTIYAVITHEDVTRRFNHGRSAKYLQNALQEMSGSVQNYIANRIKGAL